MSDRAIRHRKKLCKRTKCPLHYVSTPIGDSTPYILIRRSFKANNGSLGIENMWVPGLAASADRVVQGSLRVMPNCFAMGQASGTAAGMALEAGVQSREVSAAQLQRRLLARGAWLGESYIEV